MPPPRTRLVTVLIIIIRTLRDLLSMRSIAGRARARALIHGRLSPRSLTTPAAAGMAAGPGGCVSVSDLNFDHARCAGWGRSQQRQRASLAK
jgi:hypothetical protein